MRLNSINILNYKNIAETNLNFSSKINCIIGNNGMGKTNLLDAIYYLSFCKSHSNPNDVQNVLHDADFMMITGEYLINNINENIFCSLKRRHKKQFKRNKKEYERITDHIGLLPLVLVSPNDICLINDGSDERRKFMDGVISQYNNVYLQNLLHYNNALKQRNALLKTDTAIDESLYEIWEEQLFHYGTLIFNDRTKFINEFIPVFATNYKLISGENEEVQLNYVSQHFDRNIAESLKKTRERDKLLGYTTQGIHKDDLEMLLGNFPIKRVGSQGQNKTFLISLKFAQFKFLKNYHKFSPILLLDDIFDKLDSNRVSEIIKMVAGTEFGQIFITDTNREHLDVILNQFDDNPKIFEVISGVIKQS